MGIVSTRSRYGLRFLVELGRNSGKELVDLGSIARLEAIPEPYLIKLAARLRDAGIIVSSRGAKGGFKLAKPPERINLAEVVEALEGRSGLFGCTERPESCSRSGSCPTISVWRGLERTIKDYLTGISIADLSIPGEMDYSI